MKSSVTLKEALLLCLALFGMLAGLPFSTASAQWTQVGYMVVNGTDTMPNAYGGISGFGNNVYCATDSGVFRSGDNGDSWSNITHGFPLTRLEKMNSIFVASGGELYAGSSRRLFKSTDNGTTWSWLSGLTDSLTINAITEINNTLVISYNISFSSGGAYFSTDEGNSWTQSTGLPSLPMYYFLVDASTLFLGGRDGVYRSTDNGQTWAISGTGFPLPSGPRRVVKSGSALFAGDVGGNGMFKSIDNGMSWANTDTSTFNGFCQVFSVVEASNMILATMDGACNASEPIKMSSDGGITWAPFMNNLPTGFYPALGRNTAGTSFFTKGGPGQKKVYRYDLATGIGQSLDSHIQVALSPNPSSTEMLATWPIPLPAEAGLLAVTNLSGAVLLEIPLQAGQSAAKFDVRALPAGMYVLTMQQGGLGTVHKKFVVAR